MPTRRSRTKAQGVALHLRLYLLLRQRIADGQIAPGAMLPSEPELAKRYSTSRTTVRRALDRLEQEKWIERRHGSGTYARIGGMDQSVQAIYQDLIKDLRTLGERTTTRLLRHEIVATPALILGKHPELGPRCLLLRRTRLYGTEPFLVISHFVPLEFAELLPKKGLGDASTIIHYADAGLMPAMASQEVTAVAADLPYARELRWPVGGPLLLIRRVIKDKSRRVLEYHEALYRPDLYTFNVELSSESVGERGLRWRPARGS